MIFDAPDWCPPFGLPRPVVLPPDDEIQDLSAWLAARFDTAHTQQFTLNEVPT